MKKLLILSTLSFLSLSSGAQLRIEKTIKQIIVGEVRSMKQLVAELYYEVEEGDTTYTILYKNLQYQILTDFQAIQFSSEGGTVNHLYELLTSMLSDDSKTADYQETITLGKTVMIITKKKTVGIYYLQMYTTSGHFNLNKKQIDKLFGK